MFIGHYAAGFALKAVEKKTSLGMLFIAVQLIDFLFFIFVYIGLEKYNLVEHFTAVNHYDLYYMPYTHGLLASFLWAALIYGLWRKAVGNSRIALVMALAVLSHWFADLLMHTPDLPLLGNDSLKVGFGLWNNFTATIVVEIALFVGAVVFYLSSTTATSAKGKYAMVFFATFMIGIYIIVVTMPFDPNISVGEASGLALIVFTVFTAIAFWLDRYRA